MSHRAAPLFLQVRAKLFQNVDHFPGKTEEPPVRERRREEEKREEEKRSEGKRFSIKLEQMKTSRLKI